MAGTIRDVVTFAKAGSIAIFRGPDAASKSAAAASVAEQLGEPILTVALGEIVSKYIGETEQNLKRLFAQVEPVLDQLARAPGVVVIAVDGSAGAELAGHAVVEVRFRPDDR